ncbi:MAG: methionyl-tRNA formyltransferase [Fuerstiella sp.]
MPLRIALFGTGEFALPTFRALIESAEHDVVGVYTQPDRTGRGHHRHVNKIKVLAEEHAVPVFQPERVNRAESLQQLRQLAADVFVVAAYGQILKPEFLAIPPLGAFNLHGSLLPRHRGAAPVQYSIWEGDRLGGVTMFQIEPALDSGPMVGRVQTEIRPDETSADLMLRLAELSIELTRDVLQQLQSGTAVFESQDETQVTLAPKIRKEDGIIDWQQSACRIDCQVRAMQPWPKASTDLLVPGRPPLRCILLQVEPVGQTAAVSAGHGQGAVGSLIPDRSSVYAVTGDGLLKIKVIQPAGKKPMDAAAFVNGYVSGSAARFSSP